MAAANDHAQVINVITRFKLRTLQRFASAAISLTQMKALQTRQTQPPLLLFQCSIQCILQQNNHASINSKHQSAKSHVLFVVIKTFAQKYWKFVTTLHNNDANYASYMMWLWQCRELSIKKCLVDFVSTVSQYNIVNELALQCLIR